MGCRNYRGVRNYRGLFDANQKCSSYGNQNAAVKTTICTTDAVPELPRGRYFLYRVGTTDRVELTKTKFELYNNSSNSI
jgi:hypothetical protein